MTTVAETIKDSLTSRDKEEVSRHIKEALLKELSDTAWDEVVQEAINHPDVIYTVTEFVASVLTERLNK